MIPIQFKLEMVEAYWNFHQIGFESKFCTAICSFLESYTLINVNIDQRLAVFILWHFPRLQDVNRVCDLANKAVALILSCDLFIN